MYELILIVCLLKEPQRCEEIYLCRLGRELSRRVAGDGGPICLA